MIPSGAAHNEMILAEIDDGGVTDNPGITEAGKMLV
jgi:hypothetical protein